MRWKAGQTIVVEEIWNQKLWSARPVIVVDDDPDRLVLWSPKGTLRKVPITPLSRTAAPTRGERLMTCLAREDWILVERTWDVSTLWLMEPGAMHATWVSFLETGEQWGWYINLQEPFARTPYGVSTMDLMLDVLISPDCSQWTWKDEDEFQAMIDWGLIDRAKADAVRDEALHVIARAERRSKPFDEPWSDWTPEPSWGIPVLPKD